MDATRGRAGGLCYRTLRDGFTNMAVYRARARYGMASRIALLVTTAHDAGSGRCGGYVWCDRQSTTSSSQSSCVYRLVPLCKRNAAARQHRLRDCMVNTAVLQLCLPLQHREYHRAGVGYSKSRSGSHTYSTLWTTTLPYHEQTTPEKACGLQVVTASAAVANGKWFNVLSMLALHTRRTM